jgi:hypothetical protein
LLKRIHQIGDGCLEHGGAFDSGTVFELTPKADGGWTSRWRGLRSSRRSLNPTEPDDQFIFKFFRDAGQGFPTLNVGKQLDQDFPQNLLTRVGQFGRL